MNLYPPWLPALAFFDRLLRFGVATLFVLDGEMMIREQAHKWGPGNFYTEPVFQTWLSFGVSPALADVLVWGRIVLAGLGALLLLPFATARLGTILLTVVVSADLWLAWKSLWWWPPYRMLFVLGIVLVLVSQVLLRTRFDRMRREWEFLERERAGS